MAKYLVIVESPAKVKTVKKFLGSNYEVAASNGHVRDLPKSQLGIDIENDYEPKYITIRGKGELLADIGNGQRFVDFAFYKGKNPVKEFFLVVLAHHTGWLCCRQCVNTLQQSDDGFRQQAVHQAVGVGRAGGTLLNQRFDQ